eukprot:2607381-Ditylum_brightwellii.AAC.1
MAIEALIGELEIRHTCNHIHRHQDRGKPLHRSSQQSTDLKAIFNQTQKKKKKLVWEAQLNIVANDPATAAYYQLKLQQVHNNFHPNAYAK